jgi:tetratricopeptide (TPR) repeat protein
MRKRPGPPKYRTGLACALWLVAGAAHADKITDAEELFRRAKGLMAENKYEPACTLLEESERLDPQMGTLLNLAICHENIGKLASAWGEFRAVEQQARAANREDRVKLAHERAVKLEPRLSHIKILVPSDVKVPGLVVKIDGEVKGEPLWSGVPVDPGTRTLEATAPGKRPARLQVKVDEDGALVSVTVPKLEDEPVPKPTLHVDRLAMDEEYAANRSRRTTGLVVGAMGVAAMAVGGAFGVLAITRNEDATKACPKPCFVGSKEAQEADAATDRALLFANVSNIVLPIGLIATLIGGYVALSAGPTEGPSRAFVSPSLNGGGAGMRW